MDNTPKNPAPEVPQQIFDKFLTELPKADVSAEVIQRLKAVLATRAISEASIGKAILADNSDV